MKISLNGKWEMQIEGENEKLPITIPGTMYSGLLENNKIEDPFYGENDRDLLVLSNNNCLFERKISLDEEFLSGDKIELCFDGIDTIAQVWINDFYLADTENMHLRYQFDVKKYLVQGENKILVKIVSPTEYIKKKQSKDPLWGMCTTVDGYAHIRKGHHMFGWDWGPQLPDMGIWRNVELVTFQNGKIKDCYIVQNHKKEEVGLEVEIAAKIFEGYDQKDFEIELVINEPESGNIVRETALFDAMELKYRKRHHLSASEDDQILFINTSIKEPKLWWPNGYGEQYLYNIRINLLYKGKKIDELDKKIGLRTMTITRENDRWGETFDYTINGIRIFAMGADYIPQDAVIVRERDYSTRQLIKDCARANYNCLRIWGGGVYPEDELFDLCDEFGLILWQDFMFACGVYRLTEEFQDNIEREIKDNILRLRHHACLGLWCGNNEMEMGFVDWEVPKDERLRMDYLLMYEKLIPHLLDRYDPETFYWPASPSSGGGFLEPNADNKGDVHYWKVFHGNEHYKAFRKHYFRFASEYGMQSFPDEKTVRSYTSDDQMNAFSPISENHNKCIEPMNGNIKILLNMSGEFRLPASFSDQIYISQVFQGETIKCAVEHFRRNRGRCMGSTYWQVNDDYPVASWSSVDYYGRWKALHYFAVRFYRPILLSLIEENDICSFHITNDTFEDFQGTLHWQLRHKDGTILLKKAELVTSSSFRAQKCIEMDLSEYLQDRESRRNIYLAAQLEDHSGNLISTETMLFTFHKYFEFPKADIRITADELRESAEISVVSEHYAKSIEISTEECDLILSDNYFDLLPGEVKKIKILEIRNNKNGNKKLNKDHLKVRCVNSITY